jgi:NAD(P)-dependent dehydrogenase (short-subunit alcohol dehydrogenase family)
MVVGSTDGIGKITTHDLATKGATVLLHGWQQEMGETVLRVIMTDTGNDRLRFNNTDLSSLDNVRGLAQEIIEESPSLEVLINNASIGDGRRGEQRRELSKVGYEFRFAVNYLAPFLLTHLLGRAWSARRPHGWSTFHRSVRCQLTSRT